MIKKVKNTVPWTYFVSYLKGEEIVGTFYEKEWQNVYTYISKNVYS